MTIKTVGVPYSGSPLIYNVEKMDHWTGGGGYSYEKYSIGYSDSLSSTDPTMTIINQIKNIYT